MLNFECDYMRGACPEVLDRLVKTNMDETLGYGDDPYCKSAAGRIREICGCPDARVYFLVGGTQVNATAIYAVLKHCQGVISPVTGHINHHEAGAVEATGHKVISLPGRDGKLDATEVRNYLKAYWNDENYAHIVEPGMVYITHPTELGTLYSLRELQDMAAVCREYHIPLYLDGARLAYAIASDKTDVTLRDIASLCDIFYIGGTKCGALFGEALVIPRPELTGDLFSIIKQRGAMLAKGRLLGLQFDTLLADGLYERNGLNAIRTAGLLAKGLQAKGYRFLIPPQTNQLFVIMGNAGIERLRKKVSFSLWEHVDADHSAIRLVTDWATSEADVEALLSLL
ncbi:MAG TPA: aminotransferase class I/II-fold pyridoxal phosphate-dependent enzyme [Candidatus Coprenecus stercoravium]|uniref:Aminotransferase class I/II-fold pyridoxal phosphate-dependent enzyme n=1 Tax=Candidatus Coprenecus stercoravium TaxID=2840735 RepID=A0A9D2GPP7_9BACT|nr:aminotransferase class I/II-fold pyridoxal phosphate-dependent enzyme [Candidatus Coprenecus stercoravium]